MVHPVASEKGPLLPIAKMVRPDRPRTAQATLLTASLAIAVFQVFVLFFFAGSTRTGPPSLPFLDALAPALQPLAKGLQSTIPASLPTAVVFFATAPFLATQEKVPFARCLAAFCYLAGSTCGALLVSCGFGLASGAR